VKETAFGGVSVWCMETVAEHVVAMLIESNDGNKRTLSCDHNSHA